MEINGANISVEEQLALAHERMVALEEENRLQRNTIDNYRAKLRHHKAICMATVADLRDLTREVEEELMVTRDIVHQTTYLANTVFAPALAAYPGRVILAGTLLVIKLPHTRDIDSGAFIRMGPSGDQAVTPRFSVKPFFGNTCIHTRKLNYSCGGIPVIGIEATMEIVRVVLADVADYLSVDAQYEELAAAYLSAPGAHANSHWL
jgi:hypothetical protein